MLRGTIRSCEVARAQMMCGYAATTKGGNEMREDIIGKNFGRLTVIGYAGCVDHRPYYFCRCDCGSIVKLRLDHFAYSYSKQKSCGCSRKENSRKMMKRRWHG